ncbi:putative ubiquitin carboxyl-terminal hydrolase FAF-X [Halotydeus destructor]|nr:putative ubiquitin carboxyl-terminal hydrolase FAF-X [Halotydeus destructor]
MDINSTNDEVDACRIVDVSPLVDNGENTEKDDDENGTQERDGTEFPISELQRLEDMINRPRWVIPVLPKGELEVLLQACISLARRGLDDKCDACQRFYREGLTVSFNKVLTDDAVSGWKFEIHKYIMQNCEKLVELCVLKLSDNCLPLLDLLAILFNPNNKFHTFTANRTELVSPEKASTQPVAGVVGEEVEIYAKQSNDPRGRKGWLVDLINLFGRSNGFQIILDQFTSGKQLPVPLVAALIKPFGICYELLTLKTIESYFLPIIQVVFNLLQNLTDDELKKETKNESKNDALSVIVKSLRNLASRIPNQEETIRTLEMFRLRMILNLLQTSSFNGKMNALNEVNKVITNVSYYSHQQGNNPGNGVVAGPTQPDDDEWLTADKLVQWIKENDVLQIVLRDSLHQPQYVEKLEKIIRFVIKENALTLTDLDNLWAAQAGKHEAIVKNVHDLLAKLAWDFVPEQLDHLFECFRASWRDASKKQREKLLELIRRLAEDDKDGVMATKVLQLLWNLAKSDDVPTDIMDQALVAHVKILDYSCSQDRDAQKLEWLEKCIEELKKPDGGNWVLPALKQMREICCLYSEAPATFPGSGQGSVNIVQQQPTLIGPQKAGHTVYRHEVINRLQNEHSLVILVSENLSTYMNCIRLVVSDNPKFDPNVVYPNSRFSHVQEVQERLNFLRFLLKDGQLWLCAPQAKQIWKCLGENAIFFDDREACFKWFSLLMTEEPDLDPDVNRSFFENNIMQLDPSLVTETGMECFDKFFKAVNINEGKLVVKRRSFLTDDLELVGFDYLWRVILNGTQEVATKAIELLKETYSNLGPRLQSSQVEIHDDFIQSCLDRLRAAYDTVSVLERKDEADKVLHEVLRMTRVLELLYEYINQCDADFGEDRTILPMGRAFRGTQVVLTVRFPNQGRHIDDIEIRTHTNDTLNAVKRQILEKVKANNPNTKIDLFLDGDLLDPNDRKLVSQLPLKPNLVLTGKLYQAQSNKYQANMPSSPDSSSDSSSSSPQNVFEGSNVEAEAMLPGVIMAGRLQIVQFLFQLADLGMSLAHEPLIFNSLQVLRIMPADVETVKSVTEVCSQLSASEEPWESVSKQLDSLFFDPSATRVAYTLGVIYSLLMPAQIPLSEDARQFQFNFVKSGCGFKVIDLLTKNNFLSAADDWTKTCAYLVVLKIAKFVLTTQANYIVLSPKSNQEFVTLYTAALVHIPNPNSDCTVRDVAELVAMVLMTKDSAASHDRMVNYLPDKNTIQTLMMIAWATATGEADSLQASVDEIEKLFRQDIDTEDGKQTEVFATCREALEILSIMFMLSPRVLQSLIDEENFRKFIIDLVLICPKKSIRCSALEHFSLIATKCLIDRDILRKILELLNSHITSTVTEHYKKSREFFQLFCRLLDMANVSRYRFTLTQDLLKFETELIPNARTKLAIKGGVEEIQLEGHLGLTKEIISSLDASQKFTAGHGLSTEPKGNGLLRILIDEYIFPASTAMVLKQSLSSSQTEDVDIDPICPTPATMMAAFDVLVALCTGCDRNLKVVADTLTEMFYQTDPLESLEWEYLPPIGPRPSRGFVGLKNAGATCYMNSVLQQLYMIDEIRNGVLDADGAVDDPSEDFSGDERQETSILVGPLIESTETDRLRDESRNDYHIGVLKHIQAIFGHLALSKLQYYVPRGFWKHFKLQGEPINLREQHDAYEFYNSLVDSLDEALKALNLRPVMAKILGGSFADQKICKGCPHRYSREEPFTALNIDIRNHSNLLESLEQYVKGDLLEGANAYHCEKCNRKVDTVKRLCIKKLPPLLSIQLKRFDYDYERMCAIKFNDYFEFPRTLDMEPYTVRGLARIEGEVIDEMDFFEETSKETCTKYDLSGIVVHSGQASGGHYYSYVLYKQDDGTAKWYKFDDGEVTECKLDDEEEMRAQCFGGEYMGEIFDHMLKRMSCRRQKRWWNAYILIYRRCDTELDKMTRGVESMSLESVQPEARRNIKMPAIIRRSVQNQNIKFMHTKDQFSAEYFQFMKRLFAHNGQVVFNHVQKGDSTYSRAYINSIAMMTVKLATKFLFNICFRTKKTLRGSALEWYDAFSPHLRASSEVRAYFAHHAFLNYPDRFCEYLLDCPSTDVRSAFGKLTVFVAHFSLQDGSSEVVVPSLNGEETNTETCVNLSDRLLQSVLNLLKKEVSEHSRHLTQYFNLFYQYALIGSPEREQLLRLNVPIAFMALALEEGPGPHIKYQYADLGKLYQVVSLLIRCCDVANRQICTPNETYSAPGPLAGTPLNPFAEDPEKYIMPIQIDVAELLFAKPAYLKKLLDDASNQEDTIRLIKFCCWENPNFSKMVLSELIVQIAFSYAYELRPPLDLLLHVLLIEDSWQRTRIFNAFRGKPEDKEGLLDTIHRNKSHYQKRAYQVIKCLVNLFANCPVALQVLNSTPNFKRKWISAIAWLHEELERRPYANNQYGYNWSPPSISNETSNGYFLERSHSARITLAKAFEMCPEDESVPEHDFDEAAQGEGSSKDAFDELTTSQPLMNDDAGRDVILSVADPSSKNSSTALKQLNAVFDCIPTPGQSENSNLTELEDQGSEEIKLDLNDGYSKPAAFRRSRRIREPDLPGFQ